MIYRRRAPEVEAVEFTSEVGRRVIDGMEGDYLAYEEGRGYRYHGRAVKFGDYIIIKPSPAVMSREDFTAQFEPVPPPQVVADLEAAVKELAAVAAGPKPARKAGKP